MALTLRQMLEAHVHLGHRANKWNPKMKPFIYSKSNNYHVLDLIKSYYYTRNAIRFLQISASQGQSVLFVGTKKEAKQIVAESALECNSFYINEKWVGGLLTNWKTFRKSTKKLLRLERQEKNGFLKKLPKKEMAKKLREKEKLTHLFDGVKHMKVLPNIVVIVGQLEDKNAVNECNKLKNVRTITLLDTDCNPTLADFIIPANDDSPSAIRLILKSLSTGILDGQKLFDRNYPERPARSKFGQKPVQKAGQKPGQKPGQKSGQKPGQQSGPKLSLKAEQKAGQKPGQKPGQKAGQKPGQKLEKSGLQPGQKPNQKVGQKPNQKQGQKRELKPGPQWQKDKRFGQKPSQKFGQKPGQKFGQRFGQKQEENLENPSYKNYTNAFKKAFGHKHDQKLGEFGRPELPTVRLIRTYGQKPDPNAKIVLPPSPRQDRLDYYTSQLVKKMQRNKSAIEWKKRQEALKLAKQALPAKRAAQIPDLLERPKWVPPKETADV